MAKSVRIWIIGVNLSGQYIPLSDLKKVAVREEQTIFENYQDALDECAKLQKDRDKLIPKR